MGNFSRHSDDVHLSAIDSDKAIYVSMNHTEKLSDEKQVGIQCALLYTSTDGHRRFACLEFQ